MELFYIIGGVVIVVIIIGTIIATRKKPEISAPSQPVSQTMTDTPAQTMPSEPQQVLPSNDVITITPTILEKKEEETPKAEVPPLSSWKPSEEAAPMKVEDKDTPVTTIEQSVTEEAK